jgi:hypothetical protein
MAVLVTVRMNTGYVVNWWMFNEAASNCIWKEATVTKLNIIFRHLPGKFEENYEKEIWSVCCRDLNRALPEYKRRYWVKLCSDFAS